MLNGGVQDRVDSSHGCHLGAILQTKYPEATSNLLILSTVNPGMESDGHCPLTVCRWDNTVGSRGVRTGDWAESVQLEEDSLSTTHVSHLTVAQKNLWSFLPLHGLFVFFFIPFLLFLFSSLRFAHFHSCLTVSIVFF